MRRPRALALSFAGAALVPLALVPLALVSLALVGCERVDAADDRRPLPPLQLRPMLPTLEALAAGLPAPEDVRTDELAEYGDIALQRVPADARLAASAQRLLLEDDNAWAVLEPALEDEDVAVRQRAAWLCGESGRTVLQLPLVLRLKYELDPQAILWVADALLKLGNDCAFGWLDAAIDRPETAEQAGSMLITALHARGVGLPEQPTWEQLREQVRVVQQHWYQTGETMLPDVPPPDPQQLEARLARRLLTPNSFQLRPVDDARFVLRNCGKLGLPLMARAIHADQHYIRTMPLQELARLGPAARPVQPQILPLLGDPLSAPYAVAALGEIGATDALPFLRPMLDAREIELRAAATKALGLLGDQASRAKLEQLLQDQNEVLDVRVGAAFGLLCLGEHPAAEAFLQERERQNDYHEQVLEQLRERLQARSG